MYRTFFGLRERPFDLTANPRFLVLTEAHREALSNLEYGIASRRGITVLIGEAGTGKTTLIRTALQRQPERVRAVHLHNPVLTRPEFVELLAVQFGLSDEARQSKATLLVELEALLRNRQQSGESTVLIVDEAQSLPLDLLEEIRLLGNIETPESKLLSIVLAGQPELAERLNHESLRQLKQRIALRCDLRPLTQAETAAYLAGRIRAAGGVGAQVFTREAVVLMHQRSGGIPRIVSVIADNALLSAFALGQRPVNSRIVTEVCADLDLARPTDQPVPDTTVEPRVDAPADPAAAPSAPRVLTFESSGDDGAAAAGSAPPPARDPDDRGDPPDAGTPEQESGMFGAMYPKRKRFSFF